MNYVEVTDLQRENNRIYAVNCQDFLTGVEFEIKCRN